MSDSTDSLPFRVPPQNELADIDEFLGRWDDPAAGRPQNWYALARSPYGNVNISGRPGDYVAPDLTPWDEDWAAAIEPGIWPVVELLVHRFAFVTFSSCEGHQYRGLDLEPAIRYAGILPRGAAEEAAIEALLLRAVRRAEADPARPPAVRVAAWRLPLSCAASGRSVTVFTLDLERPDGVAWQEYFASVDAATSVVTAALAGQD